MILVSHPTGNANVRALAEAFFARGKLFRFATCIAAPGSSILPKKVRRRSFGIPRAKLWTRPLRETVRHIGSKLRLRSLVTHETGWASMDEVGRDFDRYVAGRLGCVPKGEVYTVYAYEDFALQTFRVAHKRGLKCVYDLPIAYFEVAQRLLREQAKRWPDWEPTLGGTRDSPEKLSRKKEELELAHVVISPSRFVFDSLPDDIRATKQCAIAEFGSPSVATRDVGARPNSDGRLRVLFAGAMSQRKGLADLFAAMKLVDSKAVELVVMGSLILPMNFYRDAYAPFTYEAPRPHASVLTLMQSCDVLILPSILEGRALVQQEAMACGLPLIVTRNAGGEDLIEEGKTGFLIPVGAPDAIADKIEWFARNRSQLPTMSEAARRKAESLTWAAYGEKVLNAIES